MLKTFNYEDNPWYFNNTIVTIDILSPYFGFVYLLIDKETKQKYIGKKHIWSRRINNKTKKRKKTESDWRYYFSSNKNIKLIAKTNPFRYERNILFLCKTLGETNFKELEQIIKRNALYSNEYLNDNLLGKYFRKNIIKYYPN